MVGRPRKLTREDIAIINGWLDSKTKSVLEVASYYRFGPRYPKGNMPADIKKWETLKIKAFRRALKKLGYCLSDPRYSVIPILKP